MPVCVGRRRGGGAGSYRALAVADGSMRMTLMQENPCWRPCARRNALLPGCPPLRGKFVTQETDSVSNAI